MARRQRGRLSAVRFHVAHARTCPSRQCGRVDEISVHCHGWDGLCPSAYASHRMLAIPTCIGARGTRYDHMYAALCNRYSGVFPPSQSNCISSHACCRTDFCSPERDGVNLRGDCSVGMPPAKRQHFERRPIRKEQPRAAVNASNEAAFDTSNVGSEAASNEVSSVRVAGLTAVERRQLFARLLWLSDYRLLFAMEREISGPLLQLLKHHYTSAHTRRLLQSDTAEGRSAAAAVGLQKEDAHSAAGRSEPWWQWAERKIRHHMFSQ